MIEVGLLWVLVVGEILLITGLALGAVAVLSVRRRRQDRQAAQFLVDLVKKSEPDRLKDTRELLQEGYGYQGEELSQVARGIMQGEKALYQRVINMYLRRDLSSLRELNIDVEAATDPLRKLRTGDAATPAPAAAVAGEPPAPDTSELEAIRLENESLKAELRITMETMSRMLGEYASMFGGPQGQGAVPGQQAAETPAPPEGDELQAAPASGAAAGSPPVDMNAIEGLDELANFDPVEDATDVGEAVVDETLVLSSAPAAKSEPDAGIDLMSDDFDTAFSSTVEGADPDAGTESTDEELADLWASALAEQEDEEGREEAKKS